MYVQSLRTYNFSNKGIKYEVAPSCVYFCVLRAVKLLLPEVWHLLTWRSLYYYYFNIIIYIRQSQQTEVFLLGALNDYKDA